MANDPPTTILFGSLGLSDLSLSEHDRYGATFLPEDTLFDGEVVFFDGFVGLMMIINDI